MKIDITSLALIITSIATVIYATLTYLLLRETKREKKKPIIEEMLGIVLYPLLNFLDEELTDFKKGNARVLFIRGKFRIRRKLNDLFSWGADALVYKDFRESHPDIAKKIDKHDTYLIKLETKDKEKNRNHWTKGRIWKLTKEQYEEVWKQEGKLWYDLPLDLGERDGIPIKTITHKSKLTNVMRPSTSYLKTIILGLRETYNMDNNAILSYLIDKEGITKKYTNNELIKIIGSL